jgi:hypothetical protein
MKDHKGAHKGFVHLSRTWYAKHALRAGDIIDEVMFGFYYGGGGTSGEMSVRWSELGGAIVPRLEVYDDAWDALNEFKDVIEKMAEVDGENINPEQFCKILLSCGFRDDTKEVGP